MKIFDKSSIPYIICILAGCALLTVAHINMYTSANEATASEFDMFQWAGSRDIYLVHSLLAKDERGEVRMVYRITTASEIEWGEHWIKVYTIKPEGMHMFGEWILIPRENIRCIVPVSNNLQEHLIDRRKQ